MTDHPQDYVLQLDFPGGVYGLGIKSVEGGQTVTLDLRDLRDNQVPNWEGQTIPLEATRGQIQWSLRGDEEYSVIGRTEQVDVARGISSNYACVNCCQIVYDTSWVVNGPEELLVNGDSVRFAARERDKTCYNQAFAPYDPHAVWESNNYSVIDIVAHTGLASALFASPQWIGLRGRFLAPLLPYANTPENCSVDMESIEGQGQAMGYDFDIRVDFTDGIISPTGAGGTNTATVVVQTTPAVSGKTVAFELGSEMTEDGGHEAHTGTRPRGSLASSSGTTAGNGSAQTTYTASVFGGSIRVRARMGNRSKGMDFRVLVPNLQQLGGGDNYILEGERPRHPSNHWGIATTNQRLVAIANAYKAQFYGEGAIPDDDKNRFNDMSLIFGGKFEVAGNWNLDNVNHEQHRVGRNCDFDSPVVLKHTPSRQTAMEQIFSDNDVDFGREFSAAHWHLIFQ